MIIPGFSWSAVAAAWSASICDLGDLRLRWPILVTVEDFGVEVVATWPEVEAWASGATEAEAIDRLKDEIVALHRELTAKPDASLGRLPRRWKRTLVACVIGAGEGGR